MPVTVTNLLMGPGAIHHADFGATEPADADIANDIANTSVSGDWTDLGGTQGGVTLELNQEYTELEVDQIPDIPGRRRTKREFKVNTNLAEPTLDNFIVAANGGTKTTGANFAAWDPDMDNSAEDPDYSALIFEGKAPGDFRRWVVARKTLNVATIGQEHTKDSQTVLPVEFSCHYVSSSTKPFRYIDQTS